MMKFSWSWCDLCELATPHCPQCGYNLCSGHYECEMCEKVQEEWDRLIDQGNYPKTEEEVEVYNNKE